MLTNKGTHFDPGKVDINLEKYIARSKKRLQAILKRLQWSEELLLQKNDKSTTAVTLLPDEAEPPLPASFSTNNTVVIAEDALRAIVADPKAEIPQRFSDLQCNFSREQKLQIYEHVVQNTEKLLEPELTVPINDESHQSMTFAEIVAIKKREKNQKRRKYRTSKPTHIEEVRNLVELQMQALKQYLNPNEVTPPRLCHRERDLLKQRNKLRGRSTSDDKQRKSATKEDVSDKVKRERRKCSVYRRRSPSILKNYKRRSRSHRHSASKEKTDRKSIKQSTHKSSSRDRGHRSRSRERRRRSRSKERRYKSQSRSKDSRSHKSRSRSKERRRRSRSKQRRLKSRSRSKDRKHRSRSKERRHRSRSKERRHKSRSRSRSKSRKRSHSRRDYRRRRRRSGSQENREGQRKEHYHKRSDYAVNKSYAEKGGYKEYKSMVKSKHDERRNNGNSKNVGNGLTEEDHTTKEKTQGHMEQSQSQGKDTCSDSNISDATNTSETLNNDIKLEPVINNNGLPSYYIKVEVKIDPDNKTNVLEEIKMKTEPH